MTERTLTKSEYARHRDVSPAMVTHWHKAGRIKLTDDGRYVLADESDRMLAVSLSPDRGGKGGKSPPRALDRPQTSAATGQAPDDPPSPSASYTTVRTNREAFAAKHAELDYRARVGELVERSRYDRALADGMAPALARLDTLSARLGARVAAETDVRRVQSMIDDEVVSIRQEIADTLRAMLAAAGQTRQ